MPLMVTRPVMQRRARAMRRRWRREVVLRQGWRQASSAKMSMGFGCPELSSKHQQLYSQSPFSSSQVGVGIVMDNQLIMITGSGPGAGKSTVMSEIAKKLRHRAMPALEADEDVVWGKRQLGRHPIELTAV